LTAMKRPHHNRASRVKPRLLAADDVRPDSDESVLGTLSEVARGSFVYEIRNALSANVCAEMIRRFERCTEQHYQGRIGQQQTEDGLVKRSTDLRISGREDWKPIDRVLFQSLSQALSAIAAHHPYFAANAFKDMGYNMQRTGPGEFYQWHVDGGPGAFSQRQLVAIWYLNDVEGPGGETEFLFQELKIRPQEGKLLLFPPFWTHVHRGVTLTRGIKYSATTWVGFSTPARHSPASGEDV
jgi:predicted 2-oxoglutarate/Fe(II)-dependent dioxygenase YbiX